MQTYFIPGDEVQFRATFLGASAAVGTNIVNVISISPNSTNTVIYYDQWENGYEADIANPANVWSATNAAGTQIWGDNNPANGIPPGFSNDVINAGSIIVLQSNVNVPHNPANVIFDGSDKFGSTKAIEVSFVSWPTSPGPVLADAVSIYDTSAYGTDFRAPVGQNTATNLPFPMFDYAALMIMAAQNGTVVQVDTNADGIFDVSSTINQGQSWLVSSNGGVRAGAQVAASKPVQVHLITDRRNSGYQSRWFTLDAFDRWGTTYYTPIGTTLAGEPDGVILYNPYTNLLRVSYQTASGSGVTNVPPRGTVLFMMPANSGAKFFTTNGLTFTGVNVMDVPTPGLGNNGDNYDWGCSLQPVGALTSSLLVGYGAGSTDLSANGSPAWVMALSNTTLLVDFDGNPATGPLIDGNGRHYNINIAVTAFQSTRVFDTSGDNSQTGMRVYTTNGVLLVGAWGEDPATAGTGNPYLDAGTRISGLPALTGSKSATLTNDVNGNVRFDPGDGILYTLLVNNEGGGALQNVVVNDPLPSNTFYVANSTTLNGVTVADNGVGTPYPLDGSGLPVGTIAAFSSATITFRVTITNPFPRSVSGVTNTATVTSDGGAISLRAETPVLQADLSLFKTVDNATPIVSSNVIFTIAVTNSGPANATGVTVRDLLPAGLAYVTNGIGAYTASNGIWTIGTLNVGNSATLTITARVTAPGIIINTAQVWTANESDPDSTPANSNPAEDDQGSVTLNAQPLADLSLTKTANNAIPNVGSNVIFTVAVSNAGPNTATNVTVKDFLPSGLAYVTNGTGVYAASNGIWTIGTLNVGATTSLTVTAKVVSSGPIDNIAQVWTSGQADPDSTPGNSVATEDDQGVAHLSVPPAGDVELTKTVNNPAPGVGSNVVYTITVTNKGPDTVGITVRDLLPSQVSYMSDTSGGSYTLSNGIWNVGTLAVNGSATLSITAHVNNSGSITNIAQVWTQDHFDPDSTPGNSVPTEDDQAQAVIAVASAADLSLTKTVNNATPNVGSNVTFTVVVTNAGPNTATNVTVRDVLPAGLSFVSANNGVYTSSNGIWNIGTLNVGASTSLTITATVTIGGLVIDNIAQVWTVAQFDPDSTPGNSNPAEDDQSHATLNVPEAADLELYKSVSNPTPNVGSNVTYTIIVTNKGPNVGEGVSVRDILPAGLSFVGSSGGSYNPGTGIWGIGTLPMGASTTLTINVSVVTSGSITNIAQVWTAAHFDPDSTPGNSIPSEDDQGQAVIAVPSAADLTLAKSVDNPTPLIFSNVTFTVTVTNAGPDTATSVTVQDILPAGLDFVSASPGVYTASNGIWMIGTLNVGSVTTLQITATVTNAGLVIANIAQVWTSAQFDPDSTPGNSVPTEDDQDTVLVNVGAAADLSLHKSVDNTAPSFGGNVTFTIVATNAGVNNATGVTVKDLLPAGLNYVTNGPGVYAAGSGIWTIGTLNVGSSTTLQITAMVTVAGTSVVNFAEVWTAGQFDPDSTPGNSNPTEDDQASATINVGGAADLALTKIVNNPAPNVGSNVIFTVAVTNAGPNTATNVTVQDILPAGLSFVSSSGGLYTATNGIWNIGTLNVGAVTSLTITAKVVLSGPIDNIAQVWTVTQFDPDSTPGNSNPAEDDQGQARLFVPPAGDVELTKSVNTPTNSVGSNVVYTITVTNKGPDTVEITVRDLLPSQVNYVSDTGAGSYTPSNGIWNAGTLVVGGSKTLTITAAIVNSGVITNIAQVWTQDHFDPDSTPGNSNPAEDDQGQAVTTVSPAADLSLTKTVDNSVPNFGSNVVFTIAVTNSGPNTATNLTVRDILPAGLSFVSASNGTYTASNGIWTIGTLNVGASTSLTVTVTVTNGGLSIINTAQVWTVSQFDPDSTPGNSNPAEDDQGSVRLTVPEAADLELYKSVNNPTPNVGANVTYMIVVTNRGPNLAEGVSVRDLLPTGISYVSASSGSYDSGTGIWGIGTLVAGTNATLTITATVLASGTITNIAQVWTAAHFDPDSTPGNSVPTEDDQGRAVIVPQIADLSLTKSVQPYAVVGTNVLFTIVVTNAGPDAATGASVRDLLPAGLGFVSVSGGIYAPSNGIWTIGTLAAHASTSLVVTVTVLTSGAVTNVAQVWTSDQFDPDSTPGNSNPAEDDQGSVVLTGVAPAILLIKTAGDDPDGAVEYVLAGTSVLYTYQVRNIGDTYLANIILTDDVLGPIGVYAGPLAPGASYSFFTNRVVTSSVTNLGTAVASPSDVNGAALPNIPHVADTDDAVVEIRAPAIRLTKLAGEAADGTVLYVRPGSNVVYTYIVVNTGDTPLFNIAVTDNVLGVVGQIGGPLVPGATNILYATSINILAGVTNIGVATGDPNPPENNDPDMPVVRAQDDAVVRIAFFTVTKEDTPDPVQPGQPLTWTVWVGNPSPSPVFDLVVTEQYPPLFDYVTANPPPTTSNNVWSLGTLQPGAVMPIVISGIVSTNALPGIVLTNVALAVSSNSGTNQATETTSVPEPGATEIRVVKSDQVDPVEPGSNVVYTIRVENFGPLTAYNVVVTDTYDPLFSFQGSAPAPTGSNNVWALGNLAANANYTITVTGTVSAAAADGSVIVDRVLATADNAASSSDSEVTLVVTQPPLDVVKIGSQNPVVAGQMLIYTVAVQNASTFLTVSNVTVVESYDPNFVFSSAVPPPVAGTSNTVWHLGNLPPGTLVTIVITGTVSTNTIAADVLFNTAQVFSDSGSRTVNLTTDVIAPAIAVAKTVSTGPFPGGELVIGTNGAPVTYWIVVSNTGDVPLTNVTLNDALLAYTTNVGVLAVGQSTTVAVSRAINGDLTNTVTATGVDPLGMTQTATDTAAVDQINPTITVAKTVSAGPFPGGELVIGTNGTPVTYWIVVGNAGDVTLTNVTINDALLAYSTSVGVLAAGQSATVAVSRAISGDLTNTVIAAGIDPLGVTQTATDTAMVDQIAPAITVAKTVSTGAFPGGELVSGTNGTPVTYWIVVSNAGDVPLANVTLDDVLLAYTTNVGVLAAGQSATVSVSLAISGDLTNTVTATGVDPLDVTHTAADTAVVDQIIIEEPSECCLQVFDFRACLRNSNLAWMTGRYASCNVKFTENNILSGYLVTECSGCCVAGPQGRPSSWLYLYRQADKGKILYRVPVALLLADVFVNSYNANHLPAANSETEGALWINTQYMAPNGTNTMSGFFNRSETDQGMEMDLGFTSFLAMGFGRSKTTKPTQVAVGCEVITVPGCTSLETLCGSIAGFMEYGTRCTAPYQMLCRTPDAFCLDPAGEANAVSSGTWSIRRNRSLEACDWQTVQNNILGRMRGFVLKTALPPEAD